MIDPAITILTLPGGSSSTGATSIVGIQLQLARERRPLLRQRRSLCTMERDLQHAEPEDRALQPHGREGNPDLLEQLLLRQVGDLRRLPSLHHLGEHRRRRLRDRAAATLELHVVDRVAVVAERNVDRHLVAAERVLPLRVRVRVLDRAVSARVLVVVEDDLAVQLVEFAHRLETSYAKSCFARFTLSTRRSTSSRIE